MDSRFSRFMILSCLLSILFALGACRAVPPSQPPEQTPQPSITPAVLAEPTAAAASTPTATQAPPLAVLLAPAGSDLAQAEAIRAALEVPMAQAGMLWEVRSEWNPAEEVGLQWVIALPPDLGIADLAAANPQVQFLAVGMPDVQPGANLSVIGGSVRYDQQGFLAGVISAMLTVDWRVGVISLGDTGDGKAARNGFMNGAVYFCGLCQAYHGPIFDYPLYVEIPSGASQAEWQAAVDALVQQAVKTAYVFPSAGDEAMRQALAQAGIDLISSGAPPPGLQSNWIASIDTDYISPILEHLPALQAGQGGFRVEAPLVIREVNPDLFSPGRQALVEKILGDLLNGAIDTGVDPLSGEIR